MSDHVFTRLLVANRGEIACRVMATARRLGIECVAVYTDVDADARFVREADIAWPLGASGAYLDIDAIIAAARATGAQAIHPGYGFLSENAAFAARCEAEGLVFIGPSAKTIATMGSKSAAKDCLVGSGVPLLPGYHGAAQDDACLRREAVTLGFPLLIKAVCGGGGRGMRVVDTIEAFADALAACRREAQAAFGDSQVLLERYLPRARHIEVQVFADNHGHTVHLFERDCSVQRRHQKVMEEAPAPGLDPARRQAMASAACAVARAVDYRGAGTVEFIVDCDSGDFYFMEMNTRLQVEHPITEMITGIDLVAWQLWVAAGKPLPRAQQDIVCRGHAIEIRLCAEDPARAFMPASGRIAYLREPDRPGVRVDSAVEEGDAVPADYDSLIAKLIVWADDRPQALARLHEALADYRIVGVATNLALVSAVAACEDYARGDYDTGLLARGGDWLLAPEAEAWQLAMLALAEVWRDVRPGDEIWARRDGWRLNAAPRRRIAFRDHPTVQLDTAENGDVVVALGDRRLYASHIHYAAPTLRLRLDGALREATVIALGTERVLFCAGLRLALHCPDEERAVRAAAAGSLCAPLPGRVVACLCPLATRVAAGTALMVIEAMKMEHTLHAPADGEVVAWLRQPGDRVDEGDVLIQFTRAEEEHADD